MRKSKLLPWLIPAVVFLSVSVWAKPALKERSRLGVIGQMVFVVSEIAPFAEGSVIRVGDKLTYLCIQEQLDPAATTEQCGAITSLKSLQRALENSKPGTAVQVELLRLSSAGDLEKHEMVLQTLPHPNSQAISTLGLVGKIGFMINQVDSSTPQPEVRLGDIIASTSVFGEIIDLAIFRKLINDSQTGSTLEAEVLRLNSRHTTYETTTISLKLFRYPVQVQGAEKSCNKRVNARSFLATIKTQSCPDNPCVWCCAACCPFPWSSTCCYTTCETGVYRCETMPSGIKCKSTSYCL